MGRLTPEEARELLGVYAIGALDDDERAEVEELVLADPEARAELHTLQLGVAWLDHASTGAPAQVWRTIEQDIADEVATPDVPDAPDAVVVDLDARRGSRWPRVVGIAAAVAVLALGAIGVLVARDDGGAPTVAALASQAASRAGSQTLPVVDADGDRAGRLVVADGQAFLVWSNPPAVAGAASTYQLWAITAEGPKSAGLLGADARDLTFPMGPEATGMAVTLEPRGGSRTPTGIPVATATA